MHLISTAFYVTAASAAYSQHHHHGYHNSSYPHSTRLSHHGSPTTAPCGLGNGTLTSTPQVYETAGTSSLGPSLGWPSSEQVSSSVAAQSGSEASCGTDIVTVTVTVYDTTSIAAPTTIASSAAAVSPIATYSSLAMNSIPAASTSALVDTSVAVEVSTPVAISSSYVASSSPINTAPSSSAASAIRATVASSAPASSHTGVSSSGKSSKRGVIFTGNDTDVSTAAFANTKVSWLGNWYSGAPSNFSPDMGMEFVPQLYNPSSVDNGVWDYNAKKAIANGSKHFLFLGEPKASGVSVETAVTVFMKYMQPYAAQGIKLGAPGNLQNTGDFEWTDQFLQQCAAAGCTIDFICVHWFYTPGPSGQQDFKNAVNKANATAAGKPVWVDNFGVTSGSSAAEQTEFLDAIIPWLEDYPQVERYAFLSQSRDPAGFLPLGGGNNLTPLGELYATM